jgi:polar amino acid transport system substrate-binding protein
LAGRTARCAAAIVVTAVTMLAACVHNTEDTGAPTISPPVLPTEDPAIAALLPARVASAGALVVGVNLPYPPNEFRDSSGRIVGFDVDLLDAVARVLGVRARYVESTFERIIPSVQSGTYDMGMSSFTDTVERERSVDFTDYFRAGEQWAQRAGSRAIDPDDACGLKVAVQTTTEEDTDEVPAKSAACVAKGRSAIDKVQFDEQTAATTALLLGQVDAMSADSPVTAYAVKRTDGNLRLTGPLYHAAPYGWPVAKGSPLAEALRRAVQRLIDTGDYRRIAEAWGVQTGMIDKSTVNGATS